MPYNWHEYFQLAEFLHGCKEDCVTEEALLRSAVSRAYFAAFGHARDYACEKLGFVEIGYDDHKKLVELYRSKNRLAVAQPLQFLRNSRNNCDYDDEVENILILTTNAIKEAKKVLSKLSL